MLSRASGSRKGRCVNRTVRIGTKEIILVGTAHVSKDSVQEVRESIQATNPDVVAVELCKRRYDVLRNPKNWQDTDIVGIIREKKASFLFANLVLASFQKRIGEKLGVRPGQEMHEAILVAEAADIPVALIDRPVQITLQRTWRKLSLKERFMLIVSSITAISRQKIWTRIRSKNSRRRTFSQPLWMKSERGLRP